MIKRTATLSSSALLLLASAALLSGCFDPDFGDGGFHCTPAEGAAACPEGYSCQEFGEPDNFVCRLPPTATVKVTAVTPQVKEGEKLKIKVELTGFTLVDKLGQAPVGGEGHLHVFLNDDRNNWQTSTTLETDVDLERLDVGKHEVVVQLFNNNHTAVDPAVSGSADFEIVAP